MSLRTSKSYKQYEGLERDLCRTSHNWGKFGHRQSQSTVLYRDCEPDSSVTIGYTAEVEYPPYQGHPWIYRSG